HRCQLFAVRRQSWPRIITALEGNALRRSTVDTDPVHLRPPAPVRGEIDLPSVRRPRRLRIDGAIVRKTPYLAAREIEYVDVQVPVGAAERQRELPAVRREGGRSVDARPVRNL